MLSYFIMPRFGQNFESYFDYLDRKLSTVSILELGKKIIRIFEIIHRAGYIYNDLKLDNILFGIQDKLPLKYCNWNCFESCYINLVDFGFATRYTDPETGQHINKEEVEVFRGNMIFASLNQLDFKTTSRRDDLLSLCYFLLYLFNQGTLPGININSKLNATDTFLEARKAKYGYKVDDFCSGRAKILEEFFKVIFGLRFKDTPDYEQLYGILSGLVAKEK